MSERILVVDDDPNIRKLVSSVLEEEQFKPTTCETGKEALSIVREEAFDLVILDILLP